MSLPPTQPSPDPSIAGLSGLNEGQAIEYEEVSDRGKTSAGIASVGASKRAASAALFASYRAVEFFLQTFRHPLELLDRE